MPMGCAVVNFLCMAQLSNASETLEVLGELGKGVAFGNNGKGVEQPKHVLLFITRRMHDGVSSGQCF